MSEPKNVLRAAALVAAASAGTPKPSSAPETKTDASDVRKFQLSGGSRSFVTRKGTCLVASPFNGVDCIYAETPEDVEDLLEAVRVGNAFEV